MPACGYLRRFFFVSLVGNIQLQFLREIMKKGSKQLHVWRMRIAKWVRTLMNSQELLICPTRNARAMVSARHSKNSSKNYLLLLTGSQWTTETRGGTVYYDPRERFSEQTTEYKFTLRSSTPSHSAVQSQLAMAILSPVVVSPSHAILFSQPLIVFCLLQVT